MLTHANQNLRVNGPIENWTAIAQAHVFMYSVVTHDVISFQQPGLCGCLCAEEHTYCLSIWQ